MRAFMIKFSKIAFVTLLSLLTVTSLAAIPNPKKSNEEIVTKVAQELMKQNNIPGMAVEVFANGKPHSYYFGFANPAKKTPVTSQTIFEIGSVSKLITNLVLAEQIDVNKMRLKDPIKKYVKDLPGTFDDITLQDLATHTAGLSLNVPDSVKTYADLKKYLNTWTPADAPKEAWTYSNFGVGLLGYALQNAEHKNNPDQLFQHKVLQPLGMRSTTFSVAGRMRKFYAQGFDAKGNAVKSMPVGLFPSAGGLKSSPEDMRQFLKAAIGLSGTPINILYPMRMTQSGYVKLPDSLQGLGWQIHMMNDDAAALLNPSHIADVGSLEVDEIYDKPNFNGNALIDKTGGTNGFRTYIALIPNKHSGVVILANKFIPNEQIVSAGRKILFQLAKVNQEATV
jgi:beta-lactamase class C